MVATLCTVTPPVQGEPSGRSLLKLSFLIVDHVHCVSMVHYDKHFHRTFKGSLLLVSLFRGSCVTHLSHMTCDLPLCLSPHPSGHTAHTCFLSVSVHMSLFVSVVLVCFSCQHTGAHFHVELQGALEGAPLFQSELSGSPATSIDSSSCSSSCATQKHCLPWVDGELPLRQRRE